MLNYKESVIVSDSGTIQDVTSFFECASSSV